MMHFACQLTMYLSFIAILKNILAYLLDFCFGILMMTTPVSLNYLVSGIHFFRYFFLQIFHLLILRLIFILIFTFFCVSLDELIIVVYLFLTLLVMTEL